MTWLRRGAYALGMLSVGALVALLMVRVVTNVRHANKVTDQRDTLIAALKADLSHVTDRLIVFDRELARIAADRHADPRQITRLRRQIETLSTRTGGSPTPQPTVTVTRTTRPRATVTAHPPCHGVKVNGGCVPTQMPTIRPTIHLG